MRSIELCCGAGGLALGLSRAGFKHEAVYEIDREACVTLRANQAAGVPYVRDWRIVEGDICEQTFDDIKENIDLLAAGVPCQPFSHGGKKLGDYDHRNLFPQVSRAARILRPKVILIENVAGLLNANFAEYFGYITRELASPLIVREPKETWRKHDKKLREGRNVDLGYEVGWARVNAADYGVPQWRERAIIVAVRKDLNRKWTMPQATHSLESLLWSKWHTGEYWRDHGMRHKRQFQVSKRFQSPLARLKDENVADVTLPRWRTVRDAIADLPPLRQGQTSAKDPDHFLNPGARAYDKHTGSLPDEPAKTLKAGSHGVPGGENTLYLGRSRVRYFSIRECARLQTFPDNYRFPTTWTRGMRQVGNAVPVTLGEVVGRSIAALLEKSAPVPRAR